MADKKGIEKLDAKLLSSKIVSKEYKSDLPLVHKKMNSIIKKTGKVLSDTVFETGNNALRKWLSLLAKQGASQAKLTAYLRCGLAHLTYDYVESQYKKIDPEDLISRTLVSMKNRKLHNCFFKPQIEPTAAPAKKGAKGKKKIEPVLKTLAYKKTAPKKKAVTKKKAGKKTAAKKPAAKKATAKKAAPKKTAAKKSVKKAVKKTAKKPAARKAASKKPAAKKKAVLKTLAYKKSPVKKASPKKAAKKPASKKRNIVKAISRKAEAFRSKVKKAVAGRKPAAKKAPSKKKTGTVKVYSYGDRLTHLVK
jgi:hypothetical protein